MQWSDVVKEPSRKILRQFAGLLILFSVVLTAIRWEQGRLGLIASVLGALGVVVGAIGLLVPSAVRYVYTAWMVAAFPIGWVVSRVTLAAIFYLVFTPVAWAFRLIRRDALSLRRREVSSYWTSKGGAARVEEYFRQS